jgi:hypothetical protein
MYLALLATAALAAPPSNLDIEEPEVWDDAADLLLNGPAGCWEVVGRAAWHWDLGPSGEHDGSALFTGRLTDGEWSEFWVRSLGEAHDRPRKANYIDYPTEQHFFPLVGNLHTDRVARSGSSYSSSRDEGARNVLRSTLDRVAGQASTIEVSWDEKRKAVLLTREIEMNRSAQRAPVALEFAFPNGGKNATHLDVNFPSWFSTGGFPAVRVTDARATVDGAEAAGHVFPNGETFQFTGSTFGITFSATQTITYRSFRACTP